MVLLHRGRSSSTSARRCEAPSFSASPGSADVYELLESKPDDYWAEIPCLPPHKTYVTERLTDDTAQTQAPARRRPRPRSHRRWFDGSQAGILMRRYLDLIVADDATSRSCCCRPRSSPSSWAWSSARAAPFLPVPGGSSDLIYLVLSAIWFGCLNSAREFVKELPIYLRERSVNLGIAPYLTSKLVPLAALARLPVRGSARHGLGNGVSAGELSRPRRRPVPRRDGGDGHGTGRERLRGHQRQGRGHRPHPAHPAGHPLGRGGAPGRCGPGLRQGHHGLVLVPRCDEGHIEPGDPGRQGPDGGVAGAAIRGILHSTSGWWRCWVWCSCSSPGSG